MESQMDSPRKACGFPQRTDLRPALRVHSLPTPGAYGWKPLRAFHTAPCRVASAARFIAKIFPTLRNRPRRNSYTTRWDAGPRGDPFSFIQSPCSKQPLDGPADNSTQPRKLVLECAGALAHSTSQRQVSRKERVPGRGRHNQLWRKSDGDCRSLSAGDHHRGTHCGYERQHLQL